MQQIADWLQKLGLGQYAQCFAENDITFSILADLTDQDLKEIGVSLGHRRQLLREIANLGKTTGAASVSPALPAQPIAAPTVTPPGEAAGERRYVTVMFCDLVGSTSISAQLDAEEWRDLLSAYLDAASAAVTEMGGHVTRKVGDGLMVLFGYPVAQENDAERAARAALSIQRALAEVNCRNAHAGKPPLNARVGIETGRVVIDAAGEIYGDAPNIAARVQAQAEPGTVVMTARVQHQVAGLFVVEERGSHELKGVPEPVTLFRLVRASGRGRRAGQRHLTPLVGREEEIAMLMRRWERAQQGDGQLVMIVGEPGLGKSRLIEEFHPRLREAPHTWAEWSCSQLLQNTPLHPIAEWGHRHFGGADIAAAQRLTDLENALALVNLDPAENAPLLAPLLDIPLPPDRAPALEPEVMRRRQLAALTNWVMAGARTQPAVLAFEDAHWADPTTLELLDLLTARVESLPLLVVVTHRPEFRAPWSGQAHVTELRLSRLGRRDKAALVEQVAGGAGTLPPDVIQEIAERSDGVPLFIEEMTRAALEAGGEVRLQSTFLAGATVPETLYASLTARLDRLGATARQVSQAGAAIGRQFGHYLLAAIAGVPDDTLGSALQRLEDARLIDRRGVPPEATYSFRHALLRDAAYGMLLREPRRALHARIAEAILRLRPDTAEREPHLLAWHYTGAGLAGPAIMYWQQAGERNVAQYANREAIEYFQQALDLVETLPPGANRDRLEADLRLAQVVPLSAIHGVGSLAVDACASRVEALGDRLADWPGALAVRKVVWHTCLTRQPVPRALALGHELLSLAERSGDPAHIAIACRALGYSLYIAGEQGEADLVLARGIALADGLAAVCGEDPRIICRINRGMVLCFLGYPETALRIVHEGVAKARARNNPHAVAWSLVSLADIHIFLRNAGRAEQVAAEAIDVARQHRLVQWLARAPQRRGWALCQLGDTHQGLAQLEEGLGRQHATGHMLGTTRANYYLAEGCLLAGTPEAALGHIEAAHRHAETYGEHYMSAEIHRLHAEVLHNQGIPAPEIEGHLREALNIARDQGVRLWELRAATFLARLWRDKGRVQQARELLAPVYGWFTEGFDTLDLKEAKALLNELAS